MANRKTFDAGNTVAPGDFSTPKQIRAALATLRECAGASFAILTTFELPNRWFVSPRSESESSSSNSPLRSSVIRIRKLFRSLLFVSHEHPQEQRRLQASLLEGGVANRIEIPARTTKWSSKSVDELLRWEPFTCLAPYHSGGSTHVLGFSSLALRDFVHPLSTGVLLGARSGCVIDPRSFHDALTHLTFLVGSSEAVAVNRSMTVVDTIDRVLRDCEKHIQGLPQEAMSQLPLPEHSELVELSGLAVAVAATALILTESELGDLFLTSKDPESLYLVGSCVAKPLSPRISLTAQPRQPRTIQMLSPLTLLSQPSKSLPHNTISSTSQSIVRHVHSTGRPLVINGIPDFMEMHDALHYVRPAEAFRRTKIASLRELTVPITGSGALARGHPGVFGVLNLEKRTGKYGENDLLIARHLAQYFCTQRAQVLNKAAATIIANVSSSETSSQTLSTGTVRSYCMLEGNTDTEPIVHDIPLEFCLVRDLIRQAVQALYVATRSFHITVRLASNDGQSLFRFVEWPGGKGSPELDRISTRNKGSVNAWVFRTGMLCSLKNIDSRAEINSYSGLLGVIKMEQHTAGISDDLHSSLRTREYCKSEYCLPIIVRNRVIGTLDLESMFVAAYSNQEQLIKMISEQVVLGFSRAQLSFENQLLMTLATTRLNSHEVLGVADELMSHSQLLDSTNDRHRCTQLAKRLQEIVSQVSSIAFASPSKETQSLREIIGLARGQGQVFNDLILQDPDAMLDRQIGMEHAHCLSLILKPLLRNAMSAVNLTPQGTIRVTPRCVDKSGRHYLAITISNPIQLRQFPDDKKRQAMFRIPIASDRWHLGTFMSGVLARSLGGDVFAVFNEQRKNVQVVVEVPLPSVF